MKVDTNLSQQLSRILSESVKNNPALENLLKLQTEAKKTIDQKLEEMLADNNFIKRISVPHTAKLKINWRYLFSAPFIYGMIFPAIIWHLCLEIYHHVCFRLYGIPRVNYHDYFLYDRQLLSWLNPWEKINCLYCSYVNNLVRYSAEIGGRTERYWCPIKYYRRINNHHSQYQKFIDKKSKKKFREQWEELRDFSDLQ